MGGIYWSYTDTVLDSVTECVWFHSVEPGSAFWRHRDKQKLKTASYRRRCNGPRWERQRRFREVALFSWLVQDTFEGMLCCCVSQQRKFLQQKQHRRWPTQQAQRRSITSSPPPRNGTAHQRDSEKHGDSGKMPRSIILWRSRTTCGGRFRMMFWLWQNVPFHFFRMACQRRFRSAWEDSGKMSPVHKFVRYLRACSLYSPLDPRRSGHRIQETSLQIEKRQKRIDLEAWAHALSLKTLSLNFQWVCFHFPIANGLEYITVAFGGQDPLSGFAQHEQLEVVYWVARLLPHCHSPVIMAMSAHCQPLLMDAGQAILITHHKWKQPR